jgi:ABC-type lipoprotein release transport system permease subunit
MRLEKIAWRNIFRNKRRTLLTVSIMTIGIAVYIFGLGYVEGMRLSAFEVSAGNYGHIRIIDKDFEIKNKSLDLSANVSVEIKENLKNIEEIEHIALKLGSSGIIFIEGDIEKKSLFFGIEEEKSLLTKITLKQAIKLL